MCRCASLLQLSDSEQIHDKQTLCGLVLASRAFNDIFSRLLYRTVVLYEDNSSPDTEWISFLSRSPHLSRIRTLVIILPMEIQGDNFEVLHYCILSAVIDLPKLQSLK